MNAQETKDKLALIGLQGELRSTGHPEYQRIFITDSQGVSLGRCCIRNGVYSHTKWYIDKIRWDLTGGIRVQEKIVYLWHFLLRTGRLLKPEEWNAALVSANARAQAKYDEKVKWREENPRPNGKPRKRMPQPNCRSSLSLFLLELAPTDNEIGAL